MSQYPNSEVLKSDTENKEMIHGQKCCRLSKCDDSLLNMVESPGIHKEQVGR